MAAQQTGRRITIFMAASFVPNSPADVLRLVADYPLAWVISQDLQATPLPLVAETDGSSIVSIIGHFARRNPQVAMLQTNPRALILFQGPQGYISPRLVSKPSWGPTWNYAVARFEVAIEFLPDGTDAAIRTLARHVEQARRDPWSVEEMGARYAELRQYIIGFRAHVRATHATFKLGQDEDRDTFNEIVAGLSETSLAQWMSAQRES
jgi:transcriptional regulator